jgi:para-nitrobenzyl esterase
VWIHGGGFVTGTPSSTWYDGDRFARDGVVVVSVGYRLGAEGFLNIPGAPANRAVLDWIAALEWVQRNAAAFGGDPAKVTVGGQSAGGAASLLLSTLAPARGLFRSVIPMSGSVFPAPSPDVTLELTARVAEHLGIEVDLASFERVPPAQLVEAQIAATTAPAGSVTERVGRGLRFFPFTDGEVVPVSPMRAVADGAGSDLAFLMGTTQEEFNAASRMTPMDEDEAVQGLGRMGLAEDGVAVYQKTGGTPGNWVGQAVTDRTFRIPSLRVAEARRGPGPTFHYEFQWRSPARGGMGAVHCLDLPFVFDVLDDDHVKVVAGDGPPQELADRMHGAWVAFIRDGDPGWPAFNLEQRPTMVFDETDKVVEDLHGPIRSLWR